MTTRISRSRVVRARGVLIFREPRVGAEGVETLGWHDIRGSELIRSPEGDTIPGIVAEDVFVLGQQARAGGLTIGEMGLDGSGLLASESTTWAS